MKERTDEEIVKQTEELARDLASQMGYKIERKEWFILSRNPRVQVFWRMACVAQMALTDTDPEDAFSCLEIEEDLSDTVANAHSSVAEGI